MAASNGTAWRPAAYPPPVDTQDEFIKRELDDEDERIEVGVAIVGGGTAGLATANRFLQLLADDPETLGAPGRGPRRGDREGQDLRRAQPVRRRRAAGAAAGALPRLPRGLAQGGLGVRRGHQGGGLHDADGQAAIRIPPPPPFKNHGNEVISVSALARSSSGWPRRPGRTSAPRPAATQLLVDRGPRPGRALGRQGSRQGWRAAGQLRARHGHHRAVHGAGRGLLGPPHRPGDPRVRPRPRRASRRPGSSGSRRSGRSPSRWTA